MKILWITNNVMPRFAEKYGLQTSASGSWLIDWADKLSDEPCIDLAIAFIGGKTFIKDKIENITYYCLPGNGKSMLFYSHKNENIWKQISADFHPDIVHLHGTEYTHGLAFLRSNPDVKAVVSVQGVISRIADVYFDGLPRFFTLRYFTFGEFFHLNSAFMRKLLYRKNSRYEQEIFNRCNYANVVNEWDRSLALLKNPDIRCFGIDYNLRDSFYSSPKWSIDKAHRHRIFTTPGGDTIKGLHILLKAIPIIKKVYNDVVVVVPGNDFYNCPSSGYEKYLRQLVNSLGIRENVKTVGRLDEQQMRDMMLQSNLVVIPSAIEGTSLILREAMYIGVPCITTFRGGMADFVEDKRNGFLYDFPEYQYLAARAIEVFADDQTALKFSENSIEKAEQAHDRAENIKKIVKMYNQIMED